jgi:hypothetical protein
MAAARRPAAAIAALVALAALAPRAAHACSEVLLSNRTM